MNKNKYKFAAVFAVLVLSLLIVYFREVFLGRTFVGMDTIFSTYPRMTFLRDRLLHGDVPLWAPYVYAGYPIAAEGQTGVFYPLNLLIVLIPPQYAIVAGPLLHLFLGGAFMFALCRFFKLSAASSLAAALVYADNGYVYNQLDHNGVIYALAWAPLALLLMLKALNAADSRAAIRYAISAGAVCAVMVLAGHPQLGAYFLFAVAVFFVVQAIRSRAPAARTAAVAIAAAAAAISLSAVQILPQLELSRLSTRSGTDFDYFSQFSLNPGMLISMVFPHYWGAPWNLTYRAESLNMESYGFIGLLPLMLAVAALLDRKRRPLSLTLVALALFSVAWSLGNFTPLGRLFFHVPVLNFFRVPPRMLCLFVFSGAILAGMGLETLLKLPARATAIRVLSMYAFVLSAACVLCASVASIVLHGRVVRFILEKLVPQTSSSMHQHFFHQKADMLLRLFERDMVSMGVAFLLMALLVRGRSSGDGSRKLFRGTAAAALLVITFIVADNASVASGFVNRGERGILNHKPPFLERIREHNGPDGRVYSHLNAVLFANEDRMAGKDVDYRKRMDSLRFDLPLLYKVYSMNGYSSLSLWNFQMLVTGRKRLRLLEDKSKYDLTGIRTLVDAGALDPEADRQILDLYNVRYYVRADGEGTGHEVLDLGPVATRSAVSVRCSEADGSRGSGHAPPLHQAMSLPGRQRVARISSGRISVDVEMKCDGELTLNETFYPGWKACETGGHVRTWMRTHERDGLIAVRLGPGRHRIEFVFSPRSTLTGAAVTLAGLIISMVAVCVLGCSRGRSVG